MTITLVLIALLCLAESVHHHSAYPAHWSER
jgi:hypothetical protein